MRGAPTLVQALGRRGEAGLARLLRLRPDLADPAPGSLDTLAARSLTGSSTSRALADLDDPTTRVLIGLTAGLPSELLAAEVGRTRLLRAMTRLADLALVWGDPPQVSRAARTAIGRHPAGLAPESAHPLSADRLASALAGLDEAEQEVLARLTWGPPAGRLRDADRVVDLGSASTPIDRLLALGLLRPLDSGTVLLPREVALALRGGRLFREPPVIAGVPADPADAPTPPSTTAARRLGRRLLNARPAPAGRSALDRALAEDRWVELEHASEDGTTQLDTVRVLSIGQGSAYLVRRHGRRLTVPLKRVVSARLGDPVVIEGLTLPPVNDARG